MYFFISESDYYSTASITVMAGNSKGCIEFLNLIVDDNIALEGDEEFTIIVGSSTATVLIEDDDGTLEMFIFII